MISFIYLNLSRHVASQINDEETHGRNLVLCCVNGRSRSPMYLVAYLILCYDMTEDDAMRVVKTLLLEHRDEVLDRVNALQPAMQHLSLYP